jgi:hypothetical protein
MRDEPLVSLPARQGGWWFSETSLEQRSPDPVHLRVELRVDRSCAPSSKLGVRQLHHRALCSR